MSNQNKVSYQINEDNLFSYDSFIINDANSNDSLVIENIYNNAIRSIIDENHILNENILIASESELNNIEAQLELILRSSRTKSDQKSDKFRAFIQKYSSN